ncbi:MAG TPA: DUF3105 domain-containing protein [Candidatus Limnocylindria bacterium]|nr:DUF3105 domain-containing protein [Candidatus Limnocylindria bacterium]
MQRRLGSGRSLDMRVVAIVGFLLVGVVAVGFALVSLGPKCSDACGTRQPEEGRSHVEDGTTGLTYKSVPATSGTHWIDPANWGIYGQGGSGAYADPAIESQVIHNLEHGGIEIWYQPTKIDPAGVQQLTDYVREQLRGSQYKFILSPWTGKDFGHPIAVTAWNWLLYLDKPDIGSIRQFVAAHYGEAPEPMAGPGPPNQP